MALKLALGNSMSYWKSNRVGTSGGYELSSVRKIGFEPLVGNISDTIMIKFFLI